MKLLVVDRGFVVHKTCIRTIEAAIVNLHMVTAATVLCVQHYYVTLADAFLEFNACTLKL